MATTGKRIPSLDGLRAVSILLVIIGHLWTRAYPSDLPMVLAYLGVQVFFVLSGYLITGLLQTEHYEYGRINLADFYRRRCFRIFPAAFTYILIVASLFPNCRQALPFALTYTVSYHMASMPTLFYHLWSLSVEEQFYLLWPLALVVGFRFRSRIAWGAMAAAAICRLLLSPQFPDLLALHFSFPATMDSIAAGCLLAVYEKPLRERIRWMADSAVIALAFPLATLCVAAATWEGPFSFASGLVPATIAVWICLLVERRDRILNNPFANTLGVLSYSLYLWQQPFTSGAVLPLRFGLPIMFACAAASYLLIEKPMITLGRRLQRPLPSLSPL